MDRYLALLLLACMAILPCEAVAAPRLLQNDIETLDGLGSQEIIDRLMGGFSAYVKETPDEALHYGVVRHYLDAYRKARGRALAATDVVLLLKKVEEPNFLLPHILYWLYQSGVYREMDDSNRSTVYAEVEKLARQSVGLSFQVSVGLLTRLIKMDLKRATRTQAQGTVKDAANGIASLERRNIDRAERLMSIIETHVVDSNGHRDAEACKSALDDIGRLKRGGLIGSTAYTSMLKNVVTSTNAPPAARIRTAERLLAESPDELQLFQMLTREAKRAENVDSVKKALGNLVKRHQASE